MTDNLLDDDHSLSTTLVNLVFYGACLVIIIVFWAGIYKLMCG